MKTSRMELGKRGEDIACRFLEENGHEIIERNSRSGHLETDIISFDGNGLHFVEVKSRTAPVSAAPEENVTPAKQKRLAAAALRYLNSKKRLREMGCEVTFDVVSVVFDGADVDVKYFPQAFIPMYF